MPDTRQKTISPRLGKKTRADLAMLAIDLG
jgi:hypothetical protein